MAVEFRRAVVLITSSDPENPEFGTGFVVHQDKGEIHLVTCTHVVEAVGGVDRVMADGCPAVVCCSSPPTNFDLALLKIHNPGKSYQNMMLNRTEDANPTIVTFGYYEHGEQKLSDPLYGELEKKTNVNAFYSDQISAWHIKIKEDDYFLKPGRSGSPVLDKFSGKVVAVINTREREGKKGLAVSISALAKIAPKMWTAICGPFPPKAVHDALRPDTDFLMNFEEELTAFKNIATRKDQDTRFIIVHGGGGNGKTRLLDEYRKIAVHNGLKVLPITLGPQINVNNCLNQIVCWLDICRFTCYNDYYGKYGPSESMPISVEENRQTTLTMKFYQDLSKLDFDPPPVIFFDQYEKADQLIKNWLSLKFLAYLSSQRLIVVVAGRDAIDPSPPGPGQRHFSLKGVTVDWYHRYAEISKVALDPVLINEFHKLLHGRPKEYVEYVKSQAMAGGTG